MAKFDPKPSDHFTFGLWTVGNRGGDPFGDRVRPKISPEEIVRRLGGLGAYGVNLHDNDLVPFDATWSERQRIVGSFQRALKEAGMKVPMATTNLFFDAVFKEGAFTAVDPRVRKFAVQKTMKSIDLGAELGAKVYVFWGGREGTETDAIKDPRDAIKWFREGLNFLCRYNKDQGYNFKFALEAKPNEPRSDIYTPTTGAMLGFIETLDYPEMVGVNPEVAHETMAGLNFSHAVAQALDAGKLFHIDLNGQKIGRYDQDLRFGSEDIKGMFFLIKLLVDSKWGGMYHFDSHPYRTDDLAGVWDFAAASMRTVLILKEKVRQFHAHKGIQACLKEIHKGDQKPLVYSKASASKLKSEAFPIQQLRDRGYLTERLDQMTVELLLGV